MPLASHFPVLDDRTHADIRAEALARIPRYTPEWSDLNAGDPGVALVELFAWMSELLLYRLGRVPELNYLKFLELVGIELEAARPARTILVFPVQPGFALPAVTVPRRTQVAAEASDELGPIVFETDAVLTALRSRLEKVQSFDGYAYSDLSLANTELSGFLPFGPNANGGSACLLGFSADAPLPPGAEMSLAFWPAAQRKMPPVAPCGGGAIPVAAPAKLIWEFWAGTEWRPLTVLADDTLAFTRSGIVRLTMPAAAQAVHAKLGKAQDAARWWIQARLARAAYEHAPLLAGIRANAARVEQAQTVEGEVLGGSDATPGQVLTLDSVPVLPGSLVLEIDETGAPEIWTEAPDFFASGPNDAHYVLNRATGEVRFGDGRKGRVPAANLGSPGSNIVAVRYRFGGGTRGNVAAGQVSSAMTGLAGIDVARIANPFAAAGGTDEETLDAAIARAPVALRSRDRAVTAEDFELLAKQAGPIARAKALPLHHPHFPGIDVPGVVTVLVVPDSEGPAPVPSEPLLQTVCRHLDTRRLLTTELYVTAPTYVGIAMRVEAIAAEDADTATLILDIKDSLTRWLHPLDGGNDGLGWPFGGAIFYGEAYRRTLVPGIARVSELVILLDDVEKPPCTDVPLPLGALVRVDAIDVSIRSEAEPA